MTETWCPSGILLGTMVDTHKNGVFGLPYDFKLGSYIFRVEPSDPDSVDDDVPAPKWYRELLQCSPSAGSVTEGSRLVPMRQLGRAGLCGTQLHCMTSNTSG